MKHQAALLISVLLVLGLAHASASPISSLLSRLRRTAGAGASSAPGTDPPTGRPSLDDCTNYRQLHARTLDLVGLHRSLYSSYKAERYPNEPNPQASNEMLAYLPRANNIPSAINRVNLSDNELILLHYGNLITFEDTLIRVNETETGNITESLTEVIEQLHRIIVRLENTMICVEPERSTDRVPHNNPPFHSNVTTEEQNTRTLLVLQEFDGYIPEVLTDYETLKTRYSSSS